VALRPRGPRSGPGYSLRSSASSFSGLDMVLRITIDHVQDRTKGRQKHQWLGHLGQTGCASLWQRPSMTDKPAPKPPLQLPPNCVDRTAERVGTVMAIVGATAAGKGSRGNRRSLLTGVLGGHSRWLGRSWKFLDDERHGGSEAHLLSHAGKRHGKSRGVTASRNCSSVYNALDAKKQRHNRERLILRNSICEAVFRIQPFRFARQSLQVVHGRQHEIIEIPTVALKRSRKSPPPPPSECSTALRM
jgi:hypothetical protein